MGISTAVGFQALVNVNGPNNAANDAFGYQALSNLTDGNSNVAIGTLAGSNLTSGFGNIALGAGAGQALTSGSANIYIGDLGDVSESNTIRIGGGRILTFPPPRTFIGGIRNVTTGINDAIQVVIDSAGQLGTMSSSRRFKKEIKPMDSASEAILALKPVTFHFKSDNTNTPQFGLIAEEVAEVNPDLVVRDEKGEIYTVRYDHVNAMLLNEFLKEHRKVQEQNRKLENQDIKIHQQELAIAQLKKEMETVVIRLKEHDSKIQRVSDQAEIGKAAPQLVASEQ